MYKIPYFATLVMVIALAGGIQTSTSAHAGDAGVATERRPDAAPLPADVAARVAALREYGDRFEVAIRLIEAEAAKPIGADSDCDGSGLAEIASLATD